MVHNVTLQEYLIMCHERKNKTDNYKTPELFFAPLHKEPQYECLIVKYGNLKASVFYYYSLDLPEYHTRFHFAILLPYGNYITDTYDYETATQSFNTYITEYVKCILCNYLERPRPKFREAVIFNHI